MISLRKIELILIKENMIQMVLERMFRSDEPMRGSEEFKEKERKALENILNLSRFMSKTACTHLPLHFF